MALVIQAQDKTTSKLSWEEFASILGVKYDYDRVEPQLLDNAFEQAEAWIKEYENDADVELGDDLREQIRFAVQDGMSDHWAPQKVLSENLNIESLVDSVNEWSKRGQQAAIYERELPAGEGITDWSSDYEGIQFTIANPILIAYIEAAFCVLSIGDEGSELDEIDAKQVVTTMRRIAECEGRRIDLDLDRWEDKQRGPSYSDLAKLVDASPDEVKSKEVA